MVEIQLIIIDVSYEGIDVAGIAGLLFILSILHFVDDLRGKTIITVVIFYPFHD